MKKNKSNVTGSNPRAAQLHSADAARLRYGAHGPLLCGLAAHRDGCGPRRAAARHARLTAWWLHRRGRCPATCSARTERWRHSVKTRQRKRGERSDGREVSAAGSAWRHGGTTHLPERRRRRRRRRGALGHARMEAKRRRLRTRLSGGARGEASLAVGPSGWGGQRSGRGHDTVRTAPSWRGARVGADAWQWFFELKILPDENSSKQISKSWEKFQENPWR
jgi:hypothetical protein